MGFGLSKPNFMKWIAPDYTNIAFLVGIILAALVLFALTFYLFRVGSKKTPTFFLIVAETLFMTGLLSGMTPLTIVSGIFLVSILFLAYFVNVNDIRESLSHSVLFSMKSALSVKDKRAPEHLLNVDALYDKIEKVVQEFSAKRVGALIAFERRDPLDPHISNQVLVDAPVSVELLETIFYVGTRLHDGGVVIKDDMIHEAAATFPTSTKPLLGKVGQRHRAALGLCSETDAVVVVVSEETGRISIVYDGELNHVDNANFRKEFERYMNNANQIDPTK